MQTLKSDIRNRILSAAKEQFVQRGYLKTSMREIADAVDVGVGNLYNYFENKDELFCVILRPVSDALERMLQEHHGAKGADIMLICSEEYLKSAVDEYISLINKHGELMKILLFHSQGSSFDRHVRRKLSGQSSGTVCDKYLKIGRASCRERV